MGITLGSWGLAGEAEELTLLLPIVGDAFYQLLEGEAIGFFTPVDGFDDVGSKVEDSGYIAVLVPEFTCQPEP